MPWRPESCCWHRAASSLIRLPEIYRLQNSNSNIAGSALRPPVGSASNWQHDLADFLRTALAITAKDILVEMRTRELLSSMFVFALIVGVLFNYTLDLKSAQVIDVASGL